MDPGGAGGMTTINEAITILNTILEADRGALQQLIDHRVLCNEALADHPTVQVGAVNGEYCVGVLGVINGLFGVDERQWGFIAAEYNDAGQLERFRRTPSEGEPT